ncbi:ABC transporter permease [Chryseolinea sp. T2]|uniref:ABC transporter permease n=1 Tax=Chryseolinea sp. T2 TaxID=3129255 RepID=UPI003076AE45
MLKNHLLLTLRSLAKNKVFVIINVVGMSIAIGCCIVAYFAYAYDLNFDDVHKNRESIYRVSAVRTFENTTTKYGRVPLALGTAITSAFQGIDYASRYSRVISNFKRNDDLFASDLAYVDPAFFNMFTFEFVSGSSAAIGDVSSIIVSESMSIRFFGSPEEAIGKSITQVHPHGLKEVKVAGVFRDPPMNSSFFRMNGIAFTSFENYGDDQRASENDWFSDAMVFVQVKNRSNLASVEKQLDSYVKQNNQVRENFHVKAFEIDAFTSMAHRDRDENVQSEVWPAPPAAAIIGTLIMSFLLLLIACFNLANTSIAMSARRLKEIGMRKVMGSMRLQIALQFMGETTFICLIALAVGLALADVLIAGWNIMTDNMIHLEPSYFERSGFLLFLLIVLTTTGVIAGSYPAIYLSRFQPVTILKGKLKLGGTNLFTRTLLGLQFTISLITLVSAVAFLQNARYQEAYDLGFDVRGTIVTWVNGKGEFDTYRNALQSNPDIISIAGSRGGIFSDRMHEAVAFESKQAQVDIIDVGDQYLSTMGLDLTEGRDFIKDSETDLRESVIITENMAKLFGWQDAIGKELMWRDTIRLQVVGVVRDVYTQGLWREMEPMMIRYVAPESYTQLIARTSSQKLSSVNAYMDERWSEIFPTRLYNGYLMVKGLQETNRLNMGITSGYAFLGSMALLLSVTGLFALVTLNMMRRIKEIGIRKIVGASIAGIAQRVNREFVITLVVASMLGSYAGYMWCNTLMATIWKYHQGVGVLTMLIAVSVMLLASIGTIAFRVFSIANTNPVNTLRDE